MGIDIPPPNDDTDSDPSVERMKIVEHLPFSHAFERTMYDTRVVRHTEHQMVQPIYLFPELIETPTRFPQEVAQYFTSSHCVIDDLQASIDDMPDAPVHIEIGFTADNKRHSLITSGDQILTYAVETHGMDDITRTVSSDVATKLLAALVYARQYDPRDPDAPIGFAESQLELPRDPEYSLVEQLMMTLGHHDGVSKIKTESVFHTPNGDILMARLSEGEHPTFSAIQSKLSLAEITIDESIETELYQNVVHMQQDERPVTLEKRFAEQMVADELTFIDSSGDYEQWSAICDKFLTAIEDDLKKHAHLDDDWY